jgi:ATP-dependent Lon protease
MTSNIDTRDLIPVLPLRIGALFPKVAAPFAVGRPGSLAAVEQAASREDRDLIVAGQRDPRADPDSIAAFHQVATRARVRTMQRAGESATVLVQGLERVTLEEIVQDGERLTARVSPRPLVVDVGADVDALTREITALVLKLVELTKGENVPGLETLLQSDDLARFLYTVASLIGLEPDKAQDLLEKDRVSDGLHLLHDHLTHEVRVMEVRQEIAQKAAGKMGKEQRQYLLRQQLQQIQEELGESDSEQELVNELRQRLAETELPDFAKKELERELKRLERLPPAAQEHNVVRSYLELALELPWTKTTESKVHLPEARKVLDEDHHGLQDVKQRILEHLAVLQLNPNAKAPILCLLGPPGVGKTSLGRSIARALGREFERMSLGGLHDEAELRGHRRTYVGAMPGRILKAMRRAGVRDPVLMLDEIDKLGRDFHGDPAAALLEVLDPQQNHEFCDNYLDMPFDLSKVMFITTCNTTEGIPRPLLDRMEVIRLPGYSEEDKLQIALSYLLPRQLQHGGLDPERCDIPEETLRYLVRRYTREAGVRQLERTIERLVRKVAMHFAEGRDEAVRVDVPDLAELLGPEPFFADERRLEMPPGVAAGLAWTEAGGEVLYIESVALSGRSEPTLTGQLGDVMQESARAALSCVWSRAAALQIDPARLTKEAPHVHVPSGAVPKDGPSAGVTIATALASLYTGHGVRNDTAMTGEITITGLVLPVGGIKEKILAARRAGMHRIVLPRDNVKDLRDIDAEVLAGMVILPVATIEEVWAEVIPELRLLVGQAAQAA